MYRLVTAFAALCLAACSAAPAEEAVVGEPGEGAGLTAGDREALRALDQSYAKAWLKQGPAAQSEAVLKLFAPDAVVYPDDGAKAVSGIEGLRAFWFSDEAQPMTVVSFERRAEAIEGSSALAAITGSSEIAFMRDGTRSVEAGHYIIHARPDASGHWKIERMMWSDRPVG